MYWYRDENPLSLLPWLGVLLLWWGGGWLLATHLFRLKPRERLVVGFGLGLVLYLWATNLLAHGLPPMLAFSLSGLLVLLAGLLAAWRSGERWLDLADLKVWPWLAAGLALTYFFLLTGKGLAIFDEHKNLSLISIMAGGDIPPRFYLEYPLKHIYHYGFQLLGASLMRLGGMMPWSAFDLGKAIVWALALLLAGLVGRRYIKSTRGALLAAAVLAFASGTRYLLLLLPPGLLLRADAVVKLTGTSAFVNLPFSQALLTGWTIDGGPPSAYIFAFLNGIYDPLVMSHQGAQATSLSIFLLMWLTATRIRHRFAPLLLAVVYAMWALVWETTYGLVWLATFGLAALLYWRQREALTPVFRQHLLALALSVPIALTQGGTLTELARKVIFGFEDGGVEARLHWLQAVGSGVAGWLLAWLPPLAPAGVGPSILGFSLQWPPAILSAHFEPLSLFSPFQLMVGLFELGPVILFTPWLTAWAWRRTRAGDWPLGVVALSSWIGFALPIFLQYEAGRDISRLTWQALVAWGLMLALGSRDVHWPATLRRAGAVSLALMMFGGLMLAGIQLTAVSTTQLAHRYTELDAQLASEIWDTLPYNARIFGNPGNATVLTGRLAEQLLDEPVTRRWQSLLTDLNLDVLVDYGFEFVLVSNRWPSDTMLDQIAALEAQPCVVLMTEVWDTSRVNFRKLYDIRGCD